MKDEHIPYRSSHVLVSPRLFRKALVLTACSMIVLAGFIGLPLVSAIPVIYVSPSFTIVWGADESFSINLIVASVSDLYACEIGVFYDPTLLNGTGITEGPFLKSQGLTFFTKNFDDNYNATHGRARIADSILGNVSGVSGSGVIATVSFQTKQSGSSDLVLGGTKLVDSRNAPILHTASSGSVQIVPAVRDVAVKNVNASVTEAFADQIVNIYVVVANEGNKTEAFNVTAYANDTTIGVRQVSSLPKGANFTVTVPWDTANVTSADYVIRGEAQPVPSETDLSDNIFVDGVVTILPGTHDITVENVIVSDLEFHEGETAEIQIMVANNGNYTETFAVSTYYGETPVSAQTVVGLASFGRRTLTFVWNTTGFPLNVSYSVMAVADAVQGEANLEDNTFEDGTVVIYPRLVPSLTILEVVPSNQIGEPASGFKVGTMAYFKVTINAMSMGVEPVLVTLSVFDGQQASIGVVFFQGPLVSGTSSFILGVPLSQTARIGTSWVYASIFTDWPHLGGTPYCPEKSATFQIRGT